MNPEFHRVVLDLPALREYVRRALPVTEDPDHRFYFVLLARPKYDPSGKAKNNGKALKRILATPDMLLQKILQTEMRKDAILLRDGQQIPDGVLALYLIPTPRDTRRAAIVLNQNLTKSIGDQALGGGPKWAAEPCKMATDACLASRASKHSVVTFDYDVDKSTPEGNKLLAGLWKIVRDATTIIETRGGYHVQVRTDLVRAEDKDSWYLKFKAFEPDSSGDLLSPVPGCVQGDFVPRVVKWPEIRVGSYTIFNPPPSREETDRLKADMLAGRPDVHDTVFHFVPEKMAERIVITRRVVADLVGVEMESETESPPSTPPAPAARTPRPVFPPNRLVSEAVTDGTSEPVPRPEPDPGLDP